jgi:uncharacterized protein (DUF1778 family)
MESVLIRLDEHIVNGSDQLLVRIRPQDKRTVNLAARELNLTASQFVRTLVVQAARTVVAEIASKKG